MKKKFIALVVLVFVLSGCSSQETSASNELTDTEYDADNTTIIHSNSGDSYMVSVIPYDLQYNEELFSLESISVFQNYTNYEYYLYVVLQFDFTSLSDEGYHWLMEDQLSPLPTFDTDVYLTSESNSIDNKAMSRLYYSYDRASAVCIYYLLNGCKYNFLDSDIDACIRIKQDETYTTSQGSEQQKRIYYYFNTARGLDISITDIAEAPEDIYSDILLGYERLNQTIKSLQY